MSARDHYQWHYGARPRSNWGDGDLLCPWAEGDIVEIPEGAVGFTTGRIPHAWSTHPERCKPGRYRVVSTFSIGEGDDWYVRVCPMEGRVTLWDESSDRLHIIEGADDFTADWVLVRSSDPANVRVGLREGQQ